LDGGGNPARTAIYFFAAQGFLAAHGLAFAFAFFAAQGLHFADAFLSGLHGLHFLAAGLQGPQAARAVVGMVAAIAKGRVAAAARRALLVLRIAV
jgi:hypothetical protein